MPFNPIRFATVRPTVYRCSLLNPFHSGEPPMPNFKAQLANVITGDSLSLNYIVGNIPESDSVVSAWFSVKQDVAEQDSQAIIQKVINGVQGPSGGITDDGSSDSHEAELTFELQPVDTVRLAYDIRYCYDVQVKTAAGKILTAEIGSLHVLKGVTDAL
jgi:hypothetical protein